MRKGVKSSEEDEYFLFSPLSKDLYHLEVKTNQNVDFFPSFIYVKIYLVLI
jgi:hypothetical protein